MVDLGAICLEAKSDPIRDTSEDKSTQNVSICVPISEAVAEISCIEDQNTFSRFREVSRNLCLYTHEPGGAGRDKGVHIPGPIRVSQTRR
jgi:hypothetical protein